VNAARGQLPPGLHLSEPGPDHRDANDEATFSFLVRVTD